MQITYTEKGAHNVTPLVTDRIYVGSGRGANPIHKVGSAKNYATKSVVGRVCSQSKFPKLSVARKKD